MLGTYNADTMAYNQGPQRFYDEGHPQRRPVPQRQNPLDGSQNYPQQSQGSTGDYDQQYQQGDYGYGQGGGYAPQQHQGYDQGYHQQQPSRGRGTPAPQGPHGRGYPPQQQAQYENYSPRGGSGEHATRGGDARAQGPGRGRPQDDYSQVPQQEGAPPRGDSRAGYGAAAMNGAPRRGDSRAYLNEGLPQAQGPGPGRPAMGRAPNSVPGTQQYTRAASLKSTYLQDTPWNNSYPSFPARKQSNPRNYDLTQQFGNIDINAQQDDRTRSMDSQYAPRTFSLGSGPQQNGGGQGAGYNGGNTQQRSRQQQGYQEPSRGPPDSSYAADGYNENIMTTGPPLPASLLPAAGPRAAPQQPQYDQEHNDGYGNDGYNAAPPKNAGHKKEDSVGDVYDAYFGDDGEDPNHS